MSLNANTPQDSFELGAAEVCRILNWWSGRFEGHQTNKRTSARFKIQTRLLVYVPEASAYGETESWTSTKVIGRNISTGGVGFLTLHKLVDDRSIICLEPKTLLLGSIVRQRKVHCGYWDVGVQFKKKLDPETDTELWPENHYAEMDL